MYQNYETGISFAFEHDHRSEYHPTPTTKPVNTAKHTKLKQTYRILPYVCCNTKQTNLMCNITNYKFVYKFLVKEKLSKIWHNKGSFRAETRSIYKPLPIKTKLVEPSTSYNTNCLYVRENQNRLTDEAALSVDQPRQPTCARATSIRLYAGSWGNIGILCNV